MAESIRITTPFTEEMSRKLKAGDSVLITGTIISARDAAHKAMTEALAKGEPLPVAYTPTMLAQGIKGMVGKGSRSPEVVEAMKKYGVTYFAAVGGAAALIAKSVKKYEVVGYPELGPEAVAKLTVEDFPCIVVIDSEGNNFYEMGQKPYRRL